MRPIARESHSWGTNSAPSVIRLELLIPDSTYESALSFALPKHLADLVTSSRNELGFDAPPEYQLEPHLTVLYLGKMTGNRLMHMQYALSQLCPATAMIRLDGPGCFETNGTVINIHFRVHPDHDIIQLHHQAIAVCEGMEWVPRTRYVRDSYVPHISIFDRLSISITRNELRLPSATKVLQDPAVLSDLHLIAKRMSEGFRAPGE